jgi:Asp-tRNA(Asn)/Glu-tRNA(Gln) amidotransferase B subunit
MSSFSAVRRAIDHEVTRQQAVYTAGEEVAQETR